MKLLGGSDDNRVSQVQTRAQDDAAVGYGFQRPPDFPHYDKDGSRWASGDDGLIEVKNLPLIHMQCIHIFQQSPSINSILFLFTCIMLLVCLIIFVMMDHIVVKSYQQHLHYVR